MGDLTREEKKNKIAELKEKLKKLHADRAEAEEHDWVADAQEVMDKMAKEFPRGWAFLQQSKEFVLKDLHVTASHGRVRNLWRSITGRPAIQAAAGRRATNSPVQGFASEAGMTAAWLILSAMYEYVEDFELDDLFIKYCRAVHDANYYHVPYALVIPHLHIKQYCATYGVAQYYKEEFGFEFLIEPEIEIDIGAHDAKGHTWDWSLNNLADCIFFALHDQIDIGMLDAEDLDSTVQTIIKPWKSRAKKEYLQSKFPLLGVQNLDPQIKGFLNLIQDSEQMEARYKAYKEAK